MAEEMKEQKLTCNCLRCREIGHNPEMDISKIKPKLFIDKYKSSGGTEYFISYEDPKRKVVFAFLRLRIPSPTSFQILEILPELKDCAIIRELHTYGHMVPLANKSGIMPDMKKASQHKGMGKKLMKEAERIAKKEKFKHTAVISGIGVREYYKKLGYKLNNTYMIK